MPVDHFDEARGVGREVIRKDDNGTTASDVFRRDVSESVIERLPGGTDGTIRILLVGVYSLPYPFGRVREPSGSK